MTESKQTKSNEVTPLCPVAAIWSCKQCPIHRVCPAQTVLGDKPISVSGAQSRSSGQK